MKKKTSLSLLLFLFVIAAAAQESKLPLKKWSSDDKPFVFYISGDGGYSNFSEHICTAINKAGYNVTALNSKVYFNDKKTPQQTTNDIANYLNDELSKRKDQHFILAGYSFGADITPFVANLLTDSLKKKLISIVLLSPSTTTDFEIHVWDMLGGKKKREMDVLAEINRLGTIKTAIILGSDDADFPVNNINLKNYAHQQLKGDHHYDGNVDEVVRTMIKYF